MKESFYDWCIKNNRQDLLNRWDYNLNDKTPNDITFASSKRYYFKCNKHIEHKSTLIRLASITSAGQNIKCEECYSFAQWVLDNYDQSFLDKIWNTELNSKTPWEIRAKSHHVIYLNCDKVDYHIGYKTTAARFTGGQKICGFCHGLQVHPNDSFAVFNIEKYGDNFLEKYWDYDKNDIDPYTISKSSGKKVFIKCQEKEYHGSYSVRASDFSLDKSKCPYCRGIKVHKLDSVGMKYPMIFDVWSDKNQLTPYDYTVNSGKYIWLKCNDELHSDYKKQVRDAVNCGFHCPQCSHLRTESYLEEAVRTYISDTYLYTIKHEFACTVAAINPETGRKLPYDNEVFLPNDLHLIIEVQGKQHFTITHLTVLSAKQRNTSAENVLKSQKQRDQIKKMYISDLENYFFLEIPYYTYKDESYKTLIDNKIQEILSTTQN